jgi:CBS domain-containing protein
MQISLGDVTVTLGPTLGPHEPALEALALLSATGSTEACVVAADDRFLGIVTDFELLKAALNGSLRDLQVEQLMHRRPMTLSADQTLADAARLFRDGSLSRAPVLREGRLVGIVRRQDVLCWLASEAGAITLAVVQPPRFLSPRLTPVR